MDEKRIVKLARKSIKGNRKAFEELCRLKQREIFFNALTILRDTCAAEDAAQETILSMFLDIRTLRNPEAVNSWIYTITRNKCFRALKAKNASAMELDIEDVNVEGAITEDDREFLPEAYAEDEAMRDRIYEIVLSLPEKRREAIMLYYYEDMSYREIAEVTGISAKTVSGNITRARAMIKSELEKDKEKEMRRAGSVSTKSVLGRVLDKQATKLVPAKSLAAFEVMWMASIKSIPFPAAATATTAKGALAGAKIAATAKTVTVTVCIAGTITGAALIPGYIDRQNTPGVKAEPYPSVTSTVAESDLLGGRNIAFTDGDCTCGHVNPNGASVAGLLKGDMDVTWKIKDSRGDTVAAGDGASAGSGVSKLESDGVAGEYTLHFSLDDTDGNAVSLYRVFEIDPEFDEKYPDASSHIE
ncbi:MAG: sigma-70 family RNA polymerase sigma factor [Clostridiales Family XIII bacterium]|jgi:RNA polymerase sigma-70 factor (ECF subfamily)|nr:sigma-70 family RNA polymerase sigma factor [Clostridiales Family XIII bacterium]